MAEQSDKNLNPAKGAKVSRQKIRPSQNDGTRKIDKAGGIDTNRDT